MTCRIVNPRTRALPTAHARAIAAALLLGVLPACVSTGTAVTRAEQTELLRQRDTWTAERDGGRMSWGEWARRTNPILIALLGETPEPDVVNVLARRLVLADSVDRREITPSQFEDIWRSTLQEALRRADIRARRAGDRIEDGSKGT